MVPWGRKRTTDTAIFSRILYQLSYLGKAPTCHWPGSKLKMHLSLGQRSGSTRGPSGTEVQPSKVVQRLSGNLRLKSRQWQFVKKLNPALSAIMGKTWLTKNLGTADLVLASRLRNRFEIELRNLAAQANPQ